MATPDALWGPTAARAGRHLRHPRGSGNRLARPLRWVTWRLTLALLLCPVLWVSACREARTLDEVESLLLREEREAAQTRHARVQALLPLEERGARMHRLFGPDDPLWWSVGPASLEPRETLERQLVLEGDRCMTLWAVALPADATIELEVLDAGGRRIARDAVRDSFPLLPNLCLQGPANYRVVARATRQAAEVLLQAAHIVDPLRIGASLALLAERDAATPDAVPWGPVERVHLVEGQRVSVPVAMPAGRCYSVHAVAGGPALAAAPTARPPLVAPPLPGEPGGPPRRHSGGGIRDLDLRLLDASGEELFADLGVSDVARIERFCPSETTHVRLVLEAYEGEGVAYWQLFRRGGSGSLP